MPNLSYAARIRLFESSLKVVRTEGIRKQVENAWSRLKIRGEDNIDINDNIPVAIVDLDDDISDKAKVSPCTASHISDHDDRKSGKKSPKYYASFNKKTWSVTGHHRWQSS